MDGLIRNISMRVAMASTRRDFLSTAVRKTLGWGFLVSGFFGGRQLAWAQSCTHFSPGSCPCPSTCNGPFCSDQSDGCYHGMGIDCPAAACEPPGTDNDGCNDLGSHPNQVNCWFCCCSGTKYLCSECSDSVGNTCFCSSSVGSC